MVKIWSILKKESFLEQRLYFITSFRTIVVSFIFMSYIVVTAFTLDATHINPEMRLLLEWIGFKLKNFQFDLVCEWFRNQMKL